MTPDDPSAIIDQDTHLHGIVDNLLSQLDPATPVAVDTEFHSERRYHPSLQVVQLGVAGSPVWAIDAAALDLRPLAPLLDGRTWIAHGAQQDIALLHRATGATPSGLIDTQLLAAFCGLGHPRRLTDLATEVLDHQTTRPATLSDWMARPLSGEQLAYAREDVSLLFPLVEALMARIADEELRGWASAAGAELVDAALGAPTPSDRWRNMDLAPNLDAPTRSTLDALYVWREREAARRDVPPHHVLAPSIALDLARRRPTDHAGLKANRRMPRGLLKRYAPDLLYVIDTATAAPAVPPEPPTSPAAAVLTAVCVAWALPRGVCPKFLLPRALARRTAAMGSAALDGWRREAVGDLIEATLAGRVSVSVQEGRPTLSTSTAP